MQILEQFPLLQIRFMQLLEKLAAKDGLEVRISNDFEELASIMPSLGEGITPHFAPNQNTFFEGEAFWLGLFLKNKCIGTVAVKQQKLQNENLASFSSRYWKRVYAENSENKIVFGDKPHPLMERIKGNLVYCGEIRVSPKHQLNGAGHLLSRFAKVMAFNMWPETDWFYVFCRRADFKRGLLAKHDFHEQVQDALHWTKHPSQCQSDYILGAQHSEYYQFWLRGEFDRLKKSAKKA